MILLSFPLTHNHTEGRETKEGKKRTSERRKFTTGTWLQYNTITNNINNPTINNNNNFYYCISHALIMLRLYAFLLFFSSFSFSFFLYSFY